MTSSELLHDGDGASDVEDLSAAIAVVGVAGRFPGAPDVRSLWRNLCEGVESVTFFTDEELAEAGVPESVYRHPNYVPAKAKLGDVEYFDAEFFGFNAHEAEMTDPQHRIFLECAWETLEDAGYDPSRFDGRVGVYAGQSMNTYSLYNMMRNPSMAQAFYLDYLPMMISSNDDFLATRVSYRLDLQGPAMTIQTACSTSLVSIHVASQALLGGECDLALAGGVGVKVPENVGHVHREGAGLSPDGHCRAFDRSASGIVGGSGVGLVALRRLADALEDGDPIYGVIRGSAVNNDGNLGKAGFTAPSVRGQAQVVADALAVAGVSAESIGFVEAHGAGTILGDPIEVSALTEAFREDTDQVGYCVLGSIKTNIGHLDAASGVAGFIKALLAVGEGVIPPTVHFVEPNPKLGLESSPFRVSALPQGFPAGRVRRAGVTSLGVGGTNAHAILEQPPARPASGPSRPWQILPVAARSTAALARSCERIAGAAGELDRDDSAALADVAYTLQVGRRHFPYRRAVLAQGRDQAVAALSAPVGRVGSATAHPVAFLFPGGGSQYAGMARELYRQEPVFREHVDRCAELAEDALGYDLRLLIDADRDDVEANRLLDTSAGMLTALFTVDYALARLWLSWGVRPDGMIGHSVGEYVAACLAGVFSLADAVRTVVLRGQLIDDLPEGAMLSVALTEEELTPLLDETTSLAVVNAPGQCAVSGLTDDVARLADRLLAEGVEFRRLHVRRLGHSRAMTPVLGRFAEHLRGVTLNPPAMRYVSNVTGDWATEAEATDPDYWVRQLVGTVRFADGLRTLLDGSGHVVVEVGPGTVLSALTDLSARPGDLAVPVGGSLPHPKDGRPDSAVLLGTLARLWESGVEVDWTEFSSGEDRRRVSLPTYPFERKRYWIDTVEPVPAGVAPAVPSARPAEPAVAAQVQLDADLGATLHQRPQLATEYEAPADDLERTVEAAWREMLGFERIGTRDNFFALGGTSLLTTRLLSRLREAFSVDLPLEELFRAHTIADQASIVRRLLAEAGES